MAERRTRRWDFRLVIGALLVVSSVAGVVALVAALDRTVVVYSAAHALNVGDRIDTGDVSLAEVRLGALDTHYMRAEQLPEDGAVVIRTVAEGELIPVAALGDAVSVDLASVTVEASGALPRDVAAGARVDVWVSAREEQGAYGPPVILAPGATVTRVVTSDAVGAKQGVTVELLVPRDDVAAVLDATANAASIALVSSADE